MADPDTSIRNIPDLPWEIRETLFEHLTTLLDRTHEKNPNDPLLLEFRRIANRHLPVATRDLQYEELVSLLQAIKEPYAARLLDAGLAFVAELEPLLVYDPNLLRSYVHQLPIGSLTFGSRYALVLAAKYLPLDYNGQSVKAGIDRLNAEKLRFILRLKFLEPDVKPTSARIDNRLSKWTHSQREAINRLRQLERLHYAERVIPLSVTPRTFPLLVGATGVGKSSVVRHVAESVGAHFIAASWSNWIPKGARDNQPTVETVILACTNHKKVILFVDELDKCPSEGQNDTWSRSLLGDIFAVLDGQLGWPALGQEAQKELQMPDGYSDPTTELQELVSRRLWVIGAGTWQSVFDARPSSTLGFNRPTGSVEPVEARVRSSNAIPKELLARFNPSLVALRYPDVDEIRELVARSGLKALAEKLSYQINYQDLDVRRNGLRCLEALATELLIRYQEAPAETGTSLMAVS